MKLIKTVIEFTKVHFFGILDVIYVVNPSSMLKISWNLIESLYINIYNNSIILFILINNK